MTHSRIKSMARSMQERNPEMNYTTALREVADAPIISQMSTNLAVCGYAGSGASVALHWIAADMLTRGWDVTMLGLKEPLSPWLAERVQGNSYLLHNSPNPERDYIEALKTVEPGTEDRPRLLVLDNFAYVSCGDRSFGDSPLVQYGGEQHFLDLLRKEPYTCVAVRLQRLTTNFVPPLWRANLCNVLWMGAMSTMDAQFHFHEGLDEIGWNRPRGSGVLKTFDNNLIRMVRIPTDPMLIAGMS